MGVYFYLPEFYYKYELNLTVIEMLKQHPEYFYDNIQIGAVYGTFPGAIWNGGRVFHGTTDVENIEQTIKQFNNFGVPVRFTFTNCLLEEKHIHDTYCNLIMEKANNGMNEVLVNSPILEEYLLKQYPNFKYIQSTTKCERNLDVINAACEKYFLVVPDYRDNLDANFLDNLQYKDKIEILINPYCNPNCQHRSEHYTCLSKQQLEFNNAEIFSCPDNKLSFLEAFKKYPTVLRREYITQLQEKGFKHFKIEGRTVHEADAIESYLYYMVKPEFKDEVRLTLIKKLWR